MDCYMKFQTYRQGEVSRITIWGRNAQEAWHHFFGKTKEVLPEKVRLYDEFYDEFNLTRAVEV